MGASAEAKRLIADQQVQELERKAKVYEQHPGWTSHLNQLEVAKSMLTPNTKFVITTSTFDQMGKLVSSVAGGRSLWSQAKCMMTGGCADESAKSSVPEPEPVYQQEA